MDLAGTSKKKKRRQELPTIRFDLNISKPSQDKFSEFNYNKIVLKTYKLLKKKSIKLKKQLKKSQKQSTGGDQQATVEAIRNLSLTRGEYGNLDRTNEFKLDKARVDEMLSVYRKKLILSKRLDEKLDDDNHQDDEATYDDEDEGDADDDRNLSFNSRDEENSGFDDGHHGDRPMTNGRTKGGGKSRAGSTMNDMYKFKLKNFDHLAEGYDEDDSFIDNTDAHDVNIPTNMVPTRGGFYVNKETITLKPKDHKKRAQQPDDGEVNVSDRGRSDTSANSESLLDDEEEDEESYDEDESDESDEDEEEEEEEEGEEEDENASKSNGDDEPINGKSKSEQEQKVNASRLTNAIVDSNSSSSGSVSERANKKAAKKKVKSTKTIQDDEDELNELNSAGNKNKENNNQTITTSSITSNPAAHSNGVIVVNKKRKNLDSQVTTIGEPGAVTNTSKSLKHNVNAVSCENVNTFKKKKFDDSLVKVGDQSSLNDSSVNKSQISHQILAESKLENSNNNPNKIKLNINDNSSSSNDCIPIDSEDFADSIKNKKQPSAPAVPAQPHVVNRQQQIVSNNNLVMPATTMTTTTTTTANTTNQAPVNMNANRTIPSQSVNSLPVNLPNELKLMVNNLVELFVKNSSLNIDPFTENLKMDLVKIYLESNKQNQQDKSQIFHYISLKLNRPKENLFRMCRRLLNKESNTAPKIPNSSGMNQAPFVNTKQIDQSPRMVGQPQTSPGQQQKQPIVHHHQQQQQPKKPANISNQPVAKSNLNLNDLTEEMRAKLLSLKSDYDVYKRNNMAAQFFDSAKTVNLIYSLDCVARNSRLTPQLREHFQMYLAEAFELKLDAFQRKYNQIVAQIRQNTLESNLKTKMDLLKKEIDAEMPKNIDRFNRQLSEYKAICAAMPATVEAGEKKQLPNMPRRSFELTDRMRALITSIIQIKMSLYRPPMNTTTTTSPQSADQALKLEYMNGFFDNELIPLWPKNWMPRAVLTRIYQAKYSTTQAAQQASPNRPPPTSTSTPTPAPIINLSSKNGKSVTIEPQQLNQHQQLPQFKQNVYDLVVDKHKKQAPSPVPQQPTSSGVTNVVKPHQFSNKANTSQNASLHLDEFYIQAAAVAAAATAATKPLSSSMYQSPSASPSPMAMQLSQALNFTLPNLISNPTQATNILNTISKLNSGTNFSS